MIAGLVLHGNNSQLQRMSESSPHQPPGEGYQKRAIRWGGQCLGWIGIKVVFSPIASIVLAMISNVFSYVNIKKCMRFFTFMKRGQDFIINQ